MKTIYVVVQGEYDYEGSQSTAIYSTPNKDKALDKVTAMEALKKTILEATNAIKVHMDAWDAVNPRVYPGCAKLKPTPSFPGKQKNWTKEQMAELNKVRQENFELALAAASPSHIWMNTRHEEQLRFMTTLPDDVQKNYLYISERTQFDIEEVPFEE